MPEVKETCLKCKSYTKNPEHDHYLCGVDGLCPAIKPLECEHEFIKAYLLMLGQVCQYCKKCKKYKKVREMTDEEAEKAYSNF